MFLLGGSLFLVSSTLWAVPFALGLGRQTHTLEVEPFYGTLYERGKEQLYGTPYERGKEQLYGTPYTRGERNLYWTLCISVGAN